MMFRRVAFVALVALLSVSCFVAAESAETTVFGPTTQAVPLVNRHRYLHGQAMGAALEMMFSDKWRTLLNNLMPSIGAQALQIFQQYQRATTQAKKGKASGDLMHVLQNNPVLAAYGSVETFKACGANPQLEPARCDKPGRVEWDVYLSPTNPTDLGQMKITHGSVTTAVSQGILKSFAISYTRPEVVAAPTALQWMEVFGRALDANKATPSASLTADQAQRLAASYLASPSGLILDVKSTYSSSADLDALVADLRSRWRINVHAVATFHHPQIDGMRSTGLALVHFYHSHYGILNGIGALKNGDQVMFNGGSLLALRGAEYRVDPTLLAEFAAVVRSKNIKVGIYTQEPAIGPAAVTGVINMVNASPDIFTEGYAYGHINGRAEKNSHGNGLGSAGPLLTAERAIWRTSRAASNAASAVSNAASSISNSASSAFSRLRNMVGSTPAK